jgi:hypothetical protein
MVTPIKKAKHGNVSIAEFSNEKGNTYQVQKSYKDKSGKWVNNSLNLFESELKDLSACIEEFVAEEA